MPDAGRPTDSAKLEAQASVDARLALTRVREILAAEAIEVEGPLTFNDARTAGMIVQTWQRDQATPGSRDVSSRRTKLSGAGVAATILVALAFLGLFQLGWRLLWQRVARRAGGGQVTARRVPGELRLSGPIGRGVPFDAAAAVAPGAATVTATVAAELA